jgi:hypothetical protein
LSLHLNFWKESSNELFATSSLIHCSPLPRFQDPEVLPCVLEAFSHATKNSVTPSVAGDFVRFCARDPEKSGLEGLSLMKLMQQPDILAAPFCNTSK